MAIHPTDWNENPTYVAKKITYNKSGVTYNDPDYYYLGYNPATERPDGTLPTDWDKIAVSGQANWNEPSISGQTNWTDDT